MEDSREEGELSESDTSNHCEDQDDVDVYNPVSRPISNACAPWNTCSSIPSSDEESSSADSDLDFMSCPKRRKTHYSQMEIERNGSQNYPQKNGAHRKNNIWANVLQEEELTLEIGGVGLKRLKGDRNVESYDYTQAQKLYNPPKEDFIEEEDEEETEEEIQKRLMRKRRFYDNFGESKKKEKKQIKPRNLADIEVDEEWDNEQLGCAIANALFEQKPELIVRVVEVLGRAKALELYSKTQKLEKEGGMMILNGSRRRTSGGVYLQLLKSLEGVEKNHLSQIFTTDDSKETQQWRKRKRMNRNRNKRKSKSGDGKNAEDEGLHLKGLFPDETGGTKCPGSTPVTSPTASDNEDDETALDSRMKEDQCAFLPLKEVCEKAASEIGIRDQICGEGVLLDSGIRQEEMETC